MEVRSGEGLRRSVRRGSAEISVHGLSLVGSNLANRWDEVMGDDDTKGEASYREKAGLEAPFWGGVQKARMDERQEVPSILAHAKLRAGHLVRPPCGPAPAPSDSRLPYSNLHVAFQPFDLGTATVLLT